MQNTYRGGGYYVGGSGDPSNWLCFLPFRHHCGGGRKEETKTDDVQPFPTFTQLPESMILAKGDKTQIFPFSVNAKLSSNSHIHGIIDRSSD